MISSQKIWTVLAHCWWKIHSTVHWVYSVKQYVLLQMQMQRYPKYWILKCSALHLIREIAQQKKKKNPWSVPESHSHYRSFALPEHQALQWPHSTEGFCCDQDSDYSAILHCHVRPHFQMMQQKHIEINQQSPSLTSPFDFIHRHCKWASSIFLGSLWCCALGLSCPFSLPLGNTLCTDWFYHGSRRNPRWSTGSIQVRYVFSSNPMKVMSGWLGKPGQE